MPQDTAVSQSAVKEAVALDTAAAPVRTFDKKTLEPYAADKDYNYGHDVVEVPTLWERFKAWLLSRLLLLLFDKNAGTFWLVLRYTLAVSVVLLFAYMIYKNQWRTLFLGGKKSKDKALDYTVERDNIHAIAFEEEIRKAIAAQMYGRATRLYYLQTLKTLNDKGLIDWKKEKTNQDYLQEFKLKKPNSVDFQQLTQTFEYAYYGDFPIDATTFESIQEHFKTFSGTLK
ncbi:DUF4129 domain-containing protein [Flexibacter flexilis]|nr:DUF4129 domain-containing protein [Flexibacter flexilis]